MIEADTAAQRPFELLAALLDHQTPPWPENQMPPLGHWLMFVPDTRQSSIGIDGHPERDDTDLPRRMWAGSRVRFLAPIPWDSTLRRESTVAKTTDKQGKSGRIRFVTILHRIFAVGGLVIEEEQDIVYRQAAQVGVSATPPVPESIAPLPPVVRPFKATPAQLFRFSALTFNAHRIHYDRDYATAQEGYPALVVHGPYIATLLMDHYLRHRPAAAVKGFSFRATRPIFDTDPFTLGLTEDNHGADLVAIDAAGGIAMQARVDI